MCVWFILFLSEIVSMHMVPQAFYEYSSNDSF